MRWAVWTRYCSVCAKTFTHVYQADLKKIECDCGAWVPVPAWKLLREGKKRC